MKCNWMTVLVVGVIAAVAGYFYATKQKPIEVDHKFGSGISDLLSKWRKD